MMHRSPITAPSRTCAWCQILVPLPTVAPAETSAVGCTNAWSLMTSSLWLFGLFVLARLPVGVGQLAELVYFQAFGWRLHGVLQCAHQIVRLALARELLEPLEDPREVFLLAQSRGHDLAD